MNTNDTYNHFYHMLKYNKPSLRVIRPIYTDLSIETRALKNNHLTTRFVLLARYGIIRSRRAWFMIMQGSTLAKLASKVTFEQFYPVFEQFMREVRFIQKNHEKDNEVMLDTFTKMLMDLFTVDEEI